jgi:hypothetical protein
MRDGLASVLAPPRSRDRGRSHGGRGRRPVVDVPDVGGRRRAEHPGGSNHRFGDGSGRFVKKTMDLRIFGKIISRAAREVLSADPF